MTWAYFEMRADIDALGAHWKDSGKRCKRPGGYPTTRMAPRVHFADSGHVMRVPSNCKPNFGGRSAGVGPVAVGALAATLLATRFPLNQVLARMSPSRLGHRPSGSQSKSVG